MALATKEQERKALEKIEKIVRELGENSYVATAFEGCFEIARENIENDFGLSLQETVRNLEKDLANSEHKIEGLKKLVDSYETNIHGMNTTIANLKECLKAEEKRALECERRAIEERKDITIETTDGDRDCKPFMKVEYFDHNGFRFINVVEPSGWTNSYKIDDLKQLVIE